MSDGSRDRTAAFGAALSCDVYEVAFRSRARTRNFGARRTSGDILLFLDADSVVAPDLFARALPLIATGRSVIWFRQAPLEHSAVAEIWFKLYNILTSVRPLFSPAVLMTRTYFVESGGFDESLRSLEDYDILTRAWRHGLAARCHALVRTSTRRLARLGYLRGVLHLAAAMRDPRRFEWVPIND